MPEESHLVGLLSDGVAPEIRSELRSEKGMGVNHLKWGRKCMYQDLRGGMGTARHLSKKEGDTHAVDPWGG